MHSLPYQTTQSLKKELTKCIIETYMRSSSQRQVSEMYADARGKEKYSIKSIVECNHPDFEKCPRC